MKKLFQCVLLLFAWFSAPGAELPGEDAFNAFQSNRAAFASALAAHDALSTSLMITNMAFWDEQMASRLTRIAKRAEAILTPETIPLGFDAIDYFETMRIAGSANYYRTRALYLAKLWINNDDLFFATNAMAFFEQSRSSDERIVALFGGLLAGPLTNACPPHLLVTSEVDDVLPGGQTAVVRVRIENVGDDPAENVEVRYSTNGRLGPPGLARLGDIPPGYWIVAPLAMTMPNEEIAILLDIEVTAANAKTSGFFEWLITATNCPAGP
ncbi:MAG TPA: hypothetical protein PKE26_04705 [Kiritimatiellia bacterium]|nr:hypothetical protein [Kiritimatiellia bacterium]HMO98390.1 hypothetical protein [Kiritimatiellia bacterium]